MPVKTITAEIDGKVRKITADIPDDSTPEELQDAVRAHLASAPAQPKPSRPDSLKGGPRDMPEPGKGTDRGFLASLVDQIKGAADMVTGPRTFRPATPQNVLEDAMALPGSILTKVGANNIPGALGDAAGALVVGKALGKAGAVGREAEAAVTRGAIMDRMGAAEPAPVTPPATAGPGVLSRIRQAWDAYKSVKKLSPTALGEKGFEKFLDFVEGKAEPPASPAPPAPPPEAVVPSPIPAAPVAQPAPVAAPQAAPAPPVEITPATTGATVSPMPAKAVAKARATRTKAAPTVAENATVQPERSNVITIPSPEPEFPAEVRASSARAEKATTFAQLLHDNGISYQDAAEHFTGAEWRQITDAANQVAAKAGRQTKFGAPSEASIKQTLFELKQLEKKAAAVNKNPKAAAIAAELAQEMTQ